MGYCLATLALCSACTARLGPPSSNISVDGNGTVMDAAGWGPAMPIAGAATAKNEEDPTLSSAGTELIYAINGTGPKDLYVMTRATRSDAFGAPLALPATINTGANEESPRLSEDDLTLYFGRGGDIYKSTRSSVGAAWGTAVIVAGSGNTASYEKWLAVCGGGTHFMVSRDNGVSDQDLYEGTLGTAGALAGPLNSTKTESSTFLSPDCLTVYFASNRDTQMALYMATRPTMADPWGTPAAVPTPFDVGTDNEDPWISTDQRIFVWSSLRNGTATKDLYISVR